MFAYHAKPRLDVRDLNIEVDVTPVRGTGGAARVEHEQTSGEFDMCPHHFVRRYSGETMLLLRQ
jgi:hypothetical protein